MEPGVQILGKATPGSAELLTPEALAFLAGLDREFEPTRQALMQARAVRQAEIDAGRTPDFLAETQGIRRSAWRVAPVPKDLEDRRVEITGPSSERRMVINALNSGAQVYMTDFEDAISPGWAQLMEGQRNLCDAARRTITDRSPEGREYRLNAQTATLAVRPRGLHLLERHVLVDGHPMAGSLFDFGLFFFHNAQALLDRGTAPYFYLPKMQSHLEARLWNDVFVFSQDRLGIPRGTIKATVLIEHVLAAFQVEEILYQLRDHSAGLNLGRWDYIFSFIKTFNRHPWALLPDRAQVTMASHFLRSAAELLVHVCHKRGAYAIGGMSAYIPRRDDPQSNERAMAQVRTDKERESSQGFDGAWVAHPGLVPLVSEVFGKAFSGPHQLSRVPPAQVTAQDLLAVPQGEITEGGIRNNISVALQYLDAWVQGRGAVAINYLMEDTATAEIARSQLWQWIAYGARSADHRSVTRQRYVELRSQEVAQLVEARGVQGPGALDKAVELLDELTLAPAYAEFLTVPGQKYLE